MTDMHREAFERWCERRGIATSPEHRTYEYQQAYEEWQAALRYRDEQDASGALSCAGCGEPADDPHTFDCPMVDRDEQEKKA